MKLSQISDLLEGELTGNGETEITGLAKIEEAGSGDLTFLANLKYYKFISKTNAAAIIVSKAITQRIELPHIRVENPYLAFQKMLKIIYPEEKTSFKGINELASIHDSAQIDDNVSVAPFVYIGKNAKIGQNTIIHPGCVINDGVRVGNDCVLYANITIREKCIVGNRVILHPGVVIGCDGFGFATDQQKYEKIPQVGIVVLEDDVEIGANCTIDRSTLGETRIKKGTKLDNLIQVAHNVTIGENTVIAAQSGIAGSTNIGKNVKIAGHVAVTGHIEIGDNAMIGGKSGVSKSVPSNEIWYGSGSIAGPITKQKRIEVSMRKLPQLLKKIKELEKRIFELENEVIMLEKKNA